MLVLAGGTVPRILRDSEEFALRLHVTYLRDADPEVLLADPALAPMAVLARAATPNDREVTLRRSLRAVARLPDSGRRRDLAQTAAVLAGIHLDATTIEEHMQEAGMPISFAETIPGQQLRAEGKAEGRAEGKAQGKAEGKAEVFADLLRRVHGDDPRIPALAAALVQLPTDQALAALQDGASLDDLTGRHLTH